MPEHMADEDSFILPVEKSRFKLPAMAFDVDFHPSRDVVTAALISGATHLYVKVTTDSEVCVYRSC